MGLTIDGSDSCLHGGEGGDLPERVRRRGKWGGKEAGVPARAGPTELQAVQPFLEGEAGEAGVGRR